MTTPKRHHYLPQSYLNGFARDGLLAVYDRQTSEYRNQTPKNTAVQKDFYTIQDDAGTKHTDIESFLSIVEGAAQPVIGTLSQGKLISATEKVNLSVFIAMLMTRTPEFEETQRRLLESFTRYRAKLVFHSVEQTQRILDHHRSKHPNAGNVTAESFHEFVQDERYDIEVSRSRTLQSMMQLGETLWQYFAQMNWIVFHPPSDTSFITTDAPFVPIPPRSDGTSPYANLVGVALPGVRKFVPLSNRALLLMLDKGDELGHVTISRAQVRGLNLMMAVSSFRYVIASEEALLRSVVKKSRLQEKTWAPRMRLGVS